MAVGRAQGWELRAGDGRLLGRGAGTALADRTVPSRLTSQRGIYHQEWVASASRSPG